MAGREARHHEEYIRDPFAIGYGLVALAAVLVSAPATIALVARYHGGGHAGYSIVEVIATYTLLEVIAVAAKLATVAVLDRKQARGLHTYTVLVLVVSGVAALLRGLEQGAASGIAGAALWAGAAVYAASAPVVLFVALHLLCARLHALRGQTDADAAAHATAALAPVQMAFAQTAALLDALDELQGRIAALQSNAMQGQHVAVQAPAPALPANVTPLPLPTPAPTAACPSCGQPVNPASAYRVRQRGYCAACKPVAANTGTP